ncbi:unnamed protein product [Closterium sp. Yama58-4]|nr:unnamed protein product [Closterium sp. Yama58-4]
MLRQVVARQRQLARAAAVAVSSASSSAALPAIPSASSASSASPTAVFGSCTFKIVSSFSTLRTIFLPRNSNLQAGVVGTKSCSSPISSSSLITSHGLATSAVSTSAAAATSASFPTAASAGVSTSASARTASISAAAGASGVGGGGVAMQTGRVGDAAAGEQGIGNGRIRVKTKALTKQAKHIMNILDAEATGLLREQRNMPDFKPGDVLSMKIEVPENKRRTSIVKGIVIARRNAGIGSTFRIRRMLAGVGVEMSFPLYSPNIKEITVIGTRKVRRAKLYYLRDKVARMSAV